MGVASLQQADPRISTVSRQPQTTTSPSAATDVPFNRLSRKMEIPGPSNTGMAYGSLWTPQMRPVGGYLRGVQLNIAADGGSGTGASFQPDAPYNVIQNLMFTDPFGQPIINLDGYGLHLVNLYGGQVGMLGFGNVPSALPSWTALSADGEFEFKMWVPFELDSGGYGSLATMNAASQPQMQIQWNPKSSVYATDPSATVPTLNCYADENFWGAPVDFPEIAPPDVGSSGQWSRARVQGLVSSANYQRLQLPRVGTFIHTLILVLRDSTGARIDQWPTSDLQLWVDGVPLLQERLKERYDLMYTQSGVTRPTGVLVYSFRDSVQSAISTADTYDNLLTTTPATQLEIGGTFGTISNAPAYIEVYTGELYPVGGIPYNHLSS